MDEQAAKKEAAEKNEAYKPRFCPLINGTCRIDCVCFSKAEVVYCSQAVGEYMSTYPHCRNGMFCCE